MQMSAEKQQLDPNTRLDAVPATAGIQVVRSRLVDGGLMVLAVLGLPVLIVSVSRFLEHPWNPIVYLHVASVALMIVTAVFRKRLSYGLRASVLLGVLLLLGAAGLLTYGLSGGGIMLLFTFTTLTTVIFGTRAGLIACAACLAVIAGVAAAVCSGVVTFSFDVEVYATSVTAWMIMLAGFAFLVLLIVIGLGGLHDHLVDSLRALGQSEARLRRIMDNLVGSFIYQHDTDGKFNYISKSITNVLGYSTEEFLNDINTYLTDHPVNDEVRRHTELSIQGVQQPPYEVQIRHKDGAIHWLEVSETPMRNDSDAVVGVEGIAHDITARKQMEATLRNLVAASSDGGGPKFFQGMVIQLAESLNADYTLIGELRRGETDSIHTIAVAADGKPGENFQYNLAGTPCENVVGHTVCAYSSSVSEKFPEDELLQQMKVEAYVGVPLFDSQGVATGIIAALFRHPVVDMALAKSVLQIFSSRVGGELERQRVGTALKDSERNYRTLTNVSPVGIFRTDAAGRYLYVNERWLQIVGLTAPQALADGWVDAVDPDDRSFVLGLWDDAVASGVPFEAEYRFKTPDDTTVWVFAQAAPELDQDGRTVGYVGSITDISVRKHLEGQLQQSQKMEAVGQLAGGVAHDFNNLLQVILGFGELAFMEAEPGSSVHDGLDQVLGAGKRAATLVRQLLAFSRQQVLRLDDLDLSEVVTDLAKMIRRVIGEDIALDIRCAADFPAIRADRGQIEQILLNLCVNARDAMPDGGNLILETDCVDLDAEYCRPFPWASPGRYAMLSVTDTGCGMDPETQQRIFEPFFTTKGLDKGTGLGLSTVYGIVQQHHGITNVYSEAGIGTSFKIYFPLLGESLAQIDKAIATQSPGGTETILIAEDDGPVRAIAERFLTAAGYAVLTAQDGPDAIRIFDENVDQIDFVILDVVMPKLGGRAVFDHIQARRPEIKVLFASGYSSSGIHTESILGSDMELIQKPYRRNELLLTVRRMLDAEK